MPELPDLTVYLEALQARIGGHAIQGIRVASPFILRTVTPGIDAFVGKTVTGFRRMGKRLVLEVEEEHFIVIHLMIAGRLRFYKTGAKMPARLGLIAFDFDTGSLILTEAGQKRRASVHLVSGQQDLQALNPGGAEIFDISQTEFVSALTRENHTLKRSLTDQRFIAGIGNAYSDEILHRARLSPMRQVKYLSEDDWQRLYDACKVVLQEWVDRLRAKTEGKFPEKVTAFHEEMAVHGKYRQPCPDCGKPVQRIRYATNECNYCAACQNQGHLLADRGLSRLLKKDWPRTLEALEEMHQ